MMMSRRDDVMPMVDGRPGYLRRERRRLLTDGMQAAMLIAGMPGAAWQLCIYFVSFERPSGRTQVRYESRRQLAGFPLSIAHFSLVAAASPF